MDSKRRQDRCEKRRQRLSVRPSLSGIPSLRGLNDDSYSVGSDQTSSEVDSMSVSRVSRGPPSLSQIEEGIIHDRPTTVTSTPLSPSSSVSPITSPSLQKKTNASEKLRNLDLDMLHGAYRVTSIQEQPEGSDGGLTETMTGEEEMQQIVIPNACLVEEEREQPSVPPRVYSDEEDVVPIVVAEDGMFMNKRFCQCVVCITFLIFVTLLIGLLFALAPKDQSINSANPPLPTVGGPPPTFAPTGVDAIALGDGNESIDVDGNDVDSTIEDADNTGSQVGAEDGNDNGIDHDTGIDGQPTESNGRPSPTNMPTAYQSPLDSGRPNDTVDATDSPTDNPTNRPTNGPTDSPTGSPTGNPTGSPTTATPTSSPTTSTPTSSPTSNPTTTSPTDSPIVTTGNGNGNNGNGNGNNGNGNGNGGGNGNGNGNGKGKWND